MTQKCFKDLSREEKLKLFEAYLDGEKIEFVSGGKWFVASSPFSNIGVYRIASEYTPFGQLSEEEQKELVWARHQEPNSVEMFAQPNWVPLEKFAKFHPKITYRLAK